MFRSIIKQVSIVLDFFRLALSFKMHSNNTCVQCVKIGSARGGHVPGVRERPHRRSHEPEGQAASRPARSQTRRSLSLTRHAL